MAKRYIGAGSDFFIETVLLYLKALATTHHLDINIASELKIERKANALRPDISIWRGNRVLAMIEFKAQFGWNRHTWKPIA